MYLKLVSKLVASMQKNHFWCPLKQEKFQQDQDFAEIFEEKVQNFTHSTSFTKSIVCSVCNKTVMAEKQPLTWRVF